MDGCCSCCKQAQHVSESYSVAQGPSTGRTHPRQVQVTFDADNEATTSQVTGKIHRGLKSQITTLLNPKSVESFELGGMGFMRQSSRYELGFTKDYLSGRIKFLGTDNASLKYTQSKYMAIQPDEDPDIVVNAIAKKWNLHFPKLLICILGGDKMTLANQAMEKAFRKGLVEAVLSTDVWLLTGGLNCGMMESVGQALTNYAIGQAMVKHRDVVAVGVAPLGILSQKEKLLGPERKPVLYNMDDDDDEDDGSSHTRYHLDPNHTHFILVGDEESGLGSEAGIRNKIVNKIAQSKIKGSNATVPALYLVFGGDSTVIQTVYDAVVNQKIPVLLIPDSGGAADVLAYAIRKGQTDKMIPGESSFDFNIQITHEIKVKLTDVNFKSHIQIKDHIKEIMKRRHLVNIHKQDVRIDEAILQALLNASRGGRGRHELDLAVIWNRIDLAKKELLKQRKWKDSELKHSLFYALVNNQHKFVKLFLDDGNVDLKKLLTREMLTDLYNQASESSVLYNLLDQQRKTRRYRGGNRFTLRDVSNVLKELIFDTYEPIYEKENFCSADNSFQEPLRELFLWAVLLHHFQLAKLFWKRGKPSIGGALLASKLLKAMADLLKLDPQEATEMFEHAKEFQAMAIELLNLCYIEDRHRTSLLLVRNLPEWGNSTCLDLAAAARNKQFIAHAAVQNLLNELWMGRLSRHTGIKMIWFCMCFPFTVCCLLTFMSKDDPSMPAKKKSGHQTSKDETDTHASMEDLTSPRNHNQNNKDNFQLTATDDTDDSASVRTHTMHKSRNDDGLSCFYKLKLFHEAPVVSFRLNMIAHFLFLGLFSYILLTNFREEISILEMVLMGWAFTLFTEEIRQVLQEDYRTLYHRFSAWFWGYWNCIDLISLVMFAIGVSLRFHPVTLDAARIVLALDLIVFYLRILHIFSASKFLGPKLIMIMRMMVDLVTFVAILMVFMISYGVACHAILFPNTQDPSKILKGVLYQSYFQLYGELFLEDISDEGCAAFDDEKPDHCPQHAWFGLIVLALYLFISNILLLNLLIAMLNYTFQAIQENTDTFWKFQRYQLVKEYYQRPSVVPPMIIVIHVYQLIRWAWDACFPNCKLYRSANLMKRELSQEKQLEISTWEVVKGEDYLARKKQQAHHESYKRIKLTDEKLDVLSSKVTKYFEGAKLNKALERRFNNLETQIASLEQLIRSQFGVDAADGGVDQSSKSSHLQAVLRHPKAQSLNRSRPASHMY